MKTITVTWDDVSETQQSSVQFPTEEKALAHADMLGRGSGSYNIRVTATTTADLRVTNTVGEKDLARLREIHEAKQVLTDRFAKARAVTSETSPLGYVSFETDWNASTEKATGKVHMTLECYEALVAKAFPQDVPAGTRFFDVGNEVRLNATKYGHGVGTRGTVAEYDAVTRMYLVRLADGCNERFSPREISPAEPAKGPYTGLA